jgi:hypothetical protein
VVLDTGAVKVVVAERTHEPRDRGVFESTESIRNTRTFSAAQTAYALPAGFRADCSRIGRMR